MSGALGEFEQLVLLAVLRLKQGAYGVAIRAAIEERTGRDISAGAVYTTLNRLERRKLVRSSVGETAPERSGQRRRYYTLAPEGAATLHRTYSDVASMVEGVLPDLEDLAAQSDSRG